MNKEQAKSVVRWCITTFGASLATFLATLGWVDYGTLLTVLNSEWFVGLLATAISMATGSLGWSLSAHTATSAVAAVASLDDAALRKSGVVNILTNPATSAGKALAAATPGDVVVPAIKSAPGLRA